MSEKNNVILPEEYNGQIIVPEDYFSRRREEALNNSRTRTKSYQKPSWWDDKNHWLDCISTATSNYGDDSTVTGNGTFYSNPEKYGFRRLSDEEASLPGDIVQAYEVTGSKVSSPYHGYMINEMDDNGEIKSVNYSDGYGGYNVGAENYWADKDYFDGDGNKVSGRNYRYRYIGTPAERAAIEEHNAAVRAQNITPPRIQAEVTTPAPVTAEQALSNGRETLRRLAARRQVANNL